MDTTGQFTSAAHDISPEKIENMIDAAPSFKNGSEANKEEMFIGVSEGKCYQLDLSEHGLGAVLIMPAAHANYLMNGSKLELKHVLTEDDESSFMPGMLLGQTALSIPNPSSSDANPLSPIVMINMKTAEVLLEDLKPTEQNPDAFAPVTALNDFPVP